MAFLELVAETFDLLAWPLITLVYPLYASVKAIESNSLVNNQKWLTYWVLCGLIMLFEFISAGFIEWLLFWPHIKLVITFWLVVPYFGGAIYAYERLVRPCFNLNPQSIGYWLRSKQDDSRIHNSADFFLLVERYVQEKGTEELEELIFGKVKCVEPTHFAAKNDSLASLNEKEAEAVKGIKLLDPSLAQTEYREVAVTDNNPTKKGEIVNGCSELPQSSIREKDQKEWTCDICQVCTHSEVVLQNHFQGKKHKAKAKEKELIECIHARVDSKADTTTEIKPTAGAEVSGGVCEWPESSSKYKTQKEWTCALCQVCTQSEDFLHSHLQGEAHKAKEKELMESTFTRNKKNAVAATENKATLAADGVSERPGSSSSSSSSSSSTLHKTQEEWSCDLSQLCVPNEVTPQADNQGMKHKTKEFIESNPAQTDNKTIVATDNKPTTEAEVVGSVSKRPGSSSSSSSSIPDKTKEWSCVLCQLCAGSEVSLQCHLQGKKHKAKEKKLLESTPAQTDNKAIVVMDNNPTTEAEESGGVCECLGSSSPIQDKTQELTCDLSQLCVPNEVTPQTDNQGMKHKAKELIEFACAQTENKPASEAEVSAVVCERPGSSSSVPEKANNWTCTICQLCMTNKASLYYHLRGEKHKAKEKKLMESKNKADSAENKATPATEVTLDVCKCPESLSIPDKTQEWTRAKEDELMTKQMEAVNNTPCASKSRNVDKPKAMPRKGIRAASVPKAIYVKKSEKITVGGTGIGDQWEMEPVIKLSALWCENCKLQCNSLSMLADHLRGRRHLRRHKEGGETHD